MRGATSVSSSPPTAGPILDLANVALGSRVEDESSLPLPSLPDRPKCPASLGSSPSLRRQRETSVVFGAATVVTPRIQLPEMFGEVRVETVEVFRLCVLSQSVLNQEGQLW